jgi:hypothetical protein
MNICDLFLKFNECFLRSFCDENIEKKDDGVKSFSIKFLMVFEKLPIQ